MSSDFPILSAPQAEAPARLHERALRGPLGTLRLFASTVRNTIRPGDAPGRYGAEEFLLLLAETPPAAALTVAECVRLAGAD